MHSGARSGSKLLLWTSQVTSITGQQQSIKRRPLDQLEQVLILFSLFTPSYYNYSYYAVIPQTTFWGEQGQGRGEWYKKSERWSKE
jgi:hypothetical protein